MRIAMLTNNYRPFVGGVPISVERQAEELIKLGHEVTVFAPAYGDTQEEREKVFLADEAAPERVVRYGTMRKRMDNGMVYPTLFPMEIMRAFEKEHYDCIHVHHPMFVGTLGVKLGKKYGIPVIYTCHTRYEDYLHYIKVFRVNEKSSIIKKKVVGWIREKVIPAYMGWFAKQCDLVLAPSEGMQRIITACADGACSSAVLPTGLEEQFFNPDEEHAKEIRQRYGKGKKHLLITVSRLEREKNYGFLLRGIADIRERAGDDFHVLILGDGSQKSELKVRASLLGIQDMVTFLGNIPNREVRDYLRAADLFLFASRSETQGIVLAEAFASGTPVVAVRAVGTEDIIENGVNGFLTDESEKEWADRAAECLRGANLAVMKQAARAAAENYRASKLAIYEETLYNQCICEKREEQKRAAIHGLAQSGKGEVLYESEESGAEHSAMAVH